MLILILSAIASLFSENKAAAEPPVDFFPQLQDTFSACGIRIIITDKSSKS